MRKAVATAGLAAAVVGGMLATGGVASAAPTNAKNADIVPLVCDNGQTYTVVVNSGGGNNENTTFSPGFVVGSNQHLNPVSFGDFSQYVNGELLGSEPGSARGNGQVPPHATPVSCSFSETTTDPTTGAQFTFTGSVVAYSPGNGR